MYSGSELWLQSGVLDVATIKDEADRRPSMLPLVLKETRTRNIRPRLPSTSGDVVHQLRDGRIWI